jgi:hypothetical protein
MSHTRARARTCESFTFTPSTRAPPSLQVDNVIRKYKSTTLDENDTQDLISDLQKEEGAFVRFTLDSHNCLRSLFWATAEQVCSCAARVVHACPCAHAAITQVIHTYRLPTLQQVKLYRQYGDVIIQDCTFQTSKENRPFFAAVVVDGENRCITNTWL